jgi:hypothetical protein
VGGLSRALARRYFLFLNGFGGAVRRIGIVRNVGICEAKAFYSPSSASIFSAILGSFSLNTFRSFSKSSAVFS